MSSSRSSVPPSARPADRASCCRVRLRIGILTAFRPNSVPDGVARALSVLFIAIPGFWLGMLIVLALLFWFGYKAPIVIVHVWQDPWQNLQIVIGPAVVLGLAQGAYIARMSRSCLLEVIGDDFVRSEERRVGKECRSGGRAGPSATGIGQRGFRPGAAATVE